MRSTDAPRARRSHGRPWAQDGEHARPVARAREAAAHLYPRWIACRSRCPRRRAGPARRAPRSPQDSLFSTADRRPSRRPEAGTRKQRKLLLSRPNLAPLSVLTVNASKRRYEMCALARSTALTLPSRSASGALATVVHMVDARFIPAGGVPANKSILTSRLLDHIVHAP